MVSKKESIILKGVVSYFKKLAVAVKRIFLVQLTGLYVAERRVDFFIYI